MLDNSLLLPWCLKIKSFRWFSFWPLRGSDLFENTQNVFVFSHHFVWSHHISTTIFLTLQFFCHQGAYRSKILSWMDSSSYPDRNCGSQYRLHMRWFFFFYSHCHNGGDVTSLTGNYSFQELEIMSTLVHFLIAWLYSWLILLLLFLLLIHALFLPPFFPHNLPAITAVAAPPPLTPPPLPPRPPSLPPPLPPHPVLLHLASKLIPQTVVWWSQLHDTRHFPDNWRRSGFLREDLLS